MTTQERNEVVEAAVDMLHREGLAIDRGDLRAARDYRDAYNALCAQIGMVPVPMGWASV